MNLIMLQKVKTPVKRPRKPPPKLYIGEWMRRLNLKQVAIANAVGIGEPHMSLICNGERRPSSGLLVEIAQAMGVTEQTLRQPPPSNALVRAAAEIDPSVLAKLAENLPKED